ncbi:Uncharacterized protein Rs2_45455 [Raphanus sativus]|nr:Uncharacterized protein Rs2_45455 [Raphanus sativus]
MHEVVFLGLWTHINVLRPPNLIIFNRPYNALTDVLNTHINEPLGLVTGMAFTNGMLVVGTSERLHLSYAALTKVERSTSISMMMERCISFEKSTFCYLVHKICFEGKNDMLSAWRRNVFG